MQFAMCNIFFKYLFWKATVFFFYTNWLISFCE